MHIKWKVKRPAHSLRNWGGRPFSVSGNLTGHHKHSNNTQHCHRRMPYHSEIPCDQQSMQEIAEWKSDSAASHETGYIGDTVQIEGKEVTITCSVTGALFPSELLVICSQETLSMPTARMAPYCFVLAATLIEMLLMI